MGEPDPPATPTVIEEGAARVRRPSAFAWAGREPLVYFALAGALLFGVDRVRHPPREARGDIVLTREFVDGVRRDLASRGGRAPTRAELRAALERFAEEEVLYREAAALGLDRGDPIVRRRMIQKMEVMLGGDAPEPSDAELMRWRDAHPDRYATPASVDFTQVFVDGARHPDTAADCASARARLDAAEAPTSVGDPFVDGATFTAQSRSQVELRFGGAFAEALFNAPAGRWVGPLTSRYGCHHVRVEAVTASRPAPIDAVRERLRADLLEDQRSAARRRAIQRLRTRHTIRIDEASP